MDDQLTPRRGGRKSRGDRRMLLIPVPEGVYLRFTDEARQRGLGLSEYVCSELAVKHNLEVPAYIQPSLDIGRRCIRRDLGRTSPRACQPIITPFTSERPKLAGSPWHSIHAFHWESASHLTTKERGSRSHCSAPSAPHTRNKIESLPGVWRPERGAIRKARR